MGLFLLSWVLAPALMLALFTGAGLLVRRAGGSELPGAAVPALGLAASLVVAASLTSFDATAELAGPAIVLLGAAGLVLERARLLELLRPGGRHWPLAAAVLPFGAMAAPVVFSGAPGWTGYARIVDIAHQFMFAAYLGTDGRVVPDVVDSSYLGMAEKTLAIGYPGGWQSVLAGLSDVMRTDLVWLYQPLLAMTAAMMGLAVYVLLERAIASRPLRALAGGVAAQANILVAYGLVGGFKELSAATCLTLTAAMIGRASVHRSWRSAVPAAVAVSASLASFNLTVAPWLGIFLAGFLILALWEAPRRLVTVPRLAVLAAITLALSLPTAIQAAKLAPVAAQAEGGNRTLLVDLGNLAAEMPLEAAAGIWPARDYRFPDQGDGTLTYVLIGLVLALALGGFASALRRRDRGIVLMGCAAAAAIVYFSARTGPWIQLKAIAITGPMVLACAFVGAGALRDLIPRLAGGRAALGAVGAWAAAGVVALAVLGGNALAYHDTALAPVDRLLDLRRIGERLAGHGPTLYPAHEEYAEYFLRDAKATGLVNPPSEGVGFPQVRPDAAARAPQPNYAWDLDDLELAWVEHFPTIVLRRGPSWSRPPGNYELASRTEYHEVWRQRHPPSTVLAHLPAPPSGTGRDYCRTVTRAAGRPDARDAEIAWSHLPLRVTPRLFEFARPASWRPDGPYKLLTVGQGEARGAFELPSDGRYAIWFAGSFGRGVEVHVDGRRVVTLRNRHNYPRQFELAGERDLRAGRHSLRLVRGGGDLAPGNSSGDEQPVGPIVIQRVETGARQVERAPLSEAGRVCRETPRLDWVELVR